MIFSHESLDEESNYFNFLKLDLDYIFFLNFCS